MQRFVRPFLIVEPHVFIDGLSEFSFGSISPTVQFLLFQAVEERFRDCVVGRGIGSGVGLDHIVRIEADAECF